ncbi:MAG: fumarylacetoacetate hydrolase family protein [Ilumatobacteraceae bacterium]
MLPLRILVNGVEMQSAPTSNLTHDVPALIACGSEVARPEPGDLIVTGLREGSATRGHRRCSWCPPMWSRWRSPASASCVIVWSTRTSVSYHSSMPIMAVLLCRADTGRDRRTQPFDGSRLDGDTRLCAATSIRRERPRARAARACSAS